MKSIYHKIVEPFKEDYILIGALIAIIGILNDVFEGSTTLSFLMGIPLFALSLVFLNLILKMHLELIRSKKLSTWTFFYEVLFSVFASTFFVAAWLKYPNPFKIFLMLFLAFIIFRFVVFCRFYFVIFQKIFRRRWVKVLWRLAFLLIFTALWVTINVWIISFFDINEFRVKINSPEGVETINPQEWASYVFLIANTLFFFVGWIVGFLDLFKKEPTGAKNFIWKDTKIFKIVKWFKSRSIKNHISRFYSDYFE